MPKVSVIVPVYNVERYLQQCVDSILGQTLADIEVLLLNDASTDNSLAVARAYERDPRVRVIDKPHGGLGDTRNWGVREAVGEYLAFVDSDDWLEPEALASLTAAADESGADMVLFNYVRENVEDGERRECRLPLHCPDGSDEMQAAVLRELVGPGAGSGPWRSVEMLGCAWRRLYRRAWFTEKQLFYYREQEVMLEDLPVSIQAHAQTRKVLAVDGAYYHYRYNPNSLSTRYRPGKMEMLLQCYRIVEQFLEGSGLAAQYGERHRAWLVRSAAHGALVNCFSPNNPAGFVGRWREVRAILRSPQVRQAAASVRFAGGTRADRLVCLLVRSGCTPLVYAFYSAYSRSLRKNIAKK